MIRVLDAGLFTTVQDLGRPGLCHLGVSAAGAADPVSLRVANRLVGNVESAAGLEMTLRGGRFEFLKDSWVSVCGGEFECSVPMWRAVWMRAGEQLSVGGCSRGARCYVAVRGGIDANYYLGSASTHVLSGFGGPVQKGTVLGLGICEVGEVSHDQISLCRPLDRVRVTLGAESDFFSARAMFTFLSQSWKVSEHSSRQGVWLRGGFVESPGDGVMESEGVALGAVQVPPSGEPVILFVDSQTTGGYPVVANVVGADVGVVGQLRPGWEFRFEAVSFDEARRLLRQQEAWLRAPF